MRKEWARGWCGGMLGGLGNATAAYAFVIMGYPQYAVDITLFIAFMAIAYSMCCGIAYLRAKS